ncbi:hypothetical protein ACG3SL_16295 [Sphingomonas sp. CJ20]
MKRRVQQRIGPRLFAGWLGLLTVLTCALVPLGPVSARVAGSAFDPTTATVVLYPRAARVAGDPSRVQPDRQKQRPSLVARWGQHQAADSAMAGPVRTTAAVARPRGEAPAPVRRLLGPDPRAPPPA